MSIVIKIHFLLLMGFLLGCENRDVRERYEGVWVSEDSFTFDSTDSLRRKVKLTTPKKLVLRKESDTVYLINWGDSASINLESDQTLATRQFTLEEVDNKLFLYTGASGNLKKSKVFWTRN